MAPSDLLQLPLTDISDMATTLVAISIILGVLLLSYFLSRNRVGESLDTRSDDFPELVLLSEIGRAITTAHPELEELAEIAYLETVRVLDTDFFQLGIFEGTTYRTLIWVRDGNRQENLSFVLDPENAGIMGYVRENGKSLLVSDFEKQQAKLPAQPSYDSPDPPRSGIFAPLLAGEETIGVLAIQSRRPHAFTPRHLDLLAVLANNLSSAIAAVLLRSEVEYRRLQILLTQEVARQLISLDPLVDRLRNLVTLLSQTFNAAKVDLYEYVHGDLQLRASSSAPPSHEDQQAYPRSPLVDEAASSGKPQIPEDELSVLAQDKNQSVREIAIPLSVVERILGILHILAHEDDSLSAQQIELSEMFAGQIAFAILEARNYAQHQEEAWITTVLLEVAKHAAQPGNPEQALKTVLQLTTLLAGTKWAVLLLPVEGVEHVRVGPVAGVRRQVQFELSEIDIRLEDIQVERPLKSSPVPIEVPLPESLSDPLEDREALSLVLSDGSSLLGVLLVENQPLIGRLPALLVGIANQISLRLENTRLIDVAATRQSLERELAMARSIQASFLPKTIPSYSGWEIGRTWQVAREVGGDFYDFVLLSEGPSGVRWGLVIADVADKGVPAALYMALSRTLLRSVATDLVDPGSTLGRVNHLLLTDDSSDLFVSLFYAVWEPEIGRLTYSNAGHNPPLIMEPGTQARTLTEHGMVLGVDINAKYESRTLNLEPDQLLVLYTDGVTEAISTHGGTFGRHRLENLILGLDDWQAQSVADSILDRVVRFSGSRDLSDDLTALTLRRLR